MFPLRTLVMRENTCLLAGCAVGRDYNRYGDSHETDHTASRGIDIFVADWYYAPLAWFPEAR